MPIPILLALLLAGGVVLFFIGLSRAPEVDTAAFVQERLNEYEGVQEKPLTLEEMALQQPFVERFLRPTVARQRADVDARLQRAGRPANLTPEDFGVLRLIAAAAGAVVGLLLGLLLAI